jgi:hypothetical protein
MKHREGPKIVKSGGSVRLAGRSTGHSPSLRAAPTSPVCGMSAYLIDRAGAGRDGLAHVRDGSGSTSSPATASRSFSDMASASARSETRVRFLGLEVNLGQAGVAGAHLTVIVVIEVVAK